MNIKPILISLRVGFFLAVRDIRRSNPWTTGLIVVVMMLTFLNLIVVRGILVGLIEGSSKVLRDHYTSDILLSTLEGKNYIEKSPRINELLRSLPEVKSISQRYLSQGILEAGYRTKVKKDDKTNTTTGLVAGINITEEESISNLSKQLVEGRNLNPDNTDEILVGVNLLEKYTKGLRPGFVTLKNTSVGDTVKLTINEETREVKIVGVLKAKVDAIDGRIFLQEQQLRQWMGRYDFNVNEISVKLKDPTDESIAQVKKILLANDVENYAKVQTWQEAQPQFLKDVNATFEILSNLIGSIGLAVAAITIFIVIFVNAITRRKFIGILKGIGIKSMAIEFSYILQSLFYAVSGTTLGLIIVYGVLKPYFDQNPINFPFSDGIFVAEFWAVFNRTVLLYITTIISGYLPARIVVKQHTLDAILGR